METITSRSCSLVGPAGAGVRRPLRVRVARGDVTLGAYTRVWRRVKASKPDATFGESLCDFGPASKAEILRQFHDGLMDRINCRVPGFGVGRKWSPDWQAEAIRAGRDLNRPRLRIHWLPVDFRSRFAHRLAVSE